MLQLIGVRFETDTGIFEANDSVQIMLAVGEIKEHLNLPTKSHLSDVITNIRRILDSEQKECLTIKSEIIRREKLLDKKSETGFSN